METNGWSREPSSASHQCVTLGKFQNSLNFSFSSVLEMITEVSSMGTP